MPQDPGLGPHQQPPLPPGPDSTFATVLAELTLSGKNLRRAWSRAAQVLHEAPQILPP
jgi:hypothetical protein